MAASSGDDLADAMENVLRSLVVEKKDLAAVGKSCPVDYFAADYPGRDLASAVDSACGNTAVPLKEEEEDEVDVDLNLIDAGRRRDYAIKLQADVRAMGRDVQRHRQKEADFVEQLKELEHEELTRKDLKLRSKISALEEERAQLRSREAQQAHEHEVLQMQYDEVIGQRQSCEGRVQFLMDHLINLLTHESSSACNDAILRDILIDGEERYLLSQQRLSVFLLHLEEGLHQNRMHAQQLSEVQCRTTAIHETTCSKQIKAFEQFQSPLDGNGPTCCRSAGSTSAPDGAASLASTKAFGRRVKSCASSMR
jgi:hypothetical protein